jgi:putative RNA 2'-phosphotransferase
VSGDKKNEFSRISKLLSLVLRHSPESIGLTLDANGWADIDALIAGTRKKGMHLSRTLIQTVVRDSDKQRFAISQDGLRIRANQGHSISVDLALPESIPPDILFHGTTNRSLLGIRQEGIKPGKRIHVHFSLDEATAMKVGSRHGPPLVLRVRAGRMHRDGFHFFLSENGVWLTGWVPVKYIDFGAQRESLP